jgi:C1A family cysteine protease
MIDLNKRLGWKPEPPDARDVKLGAHLALRLPDSLPNTISLREKQSPVRDQGETNSCTGFALAALREYLEIVDQERGNPEATKGFLSPLFIYNKEREREGTLEIDCGAYLRDGLKILQKWGVPKEEHFPFLPENIKISPFVGEASYLHCIYAYMKIACLQEAKIALAMKLPVVCGLSIYENWDLPIVWKQGLIPDPQGRVVGGHAVLLVGYNDEKQQLTYKNSWGEQWGDRGYFHTDYNYFEKNGADFWTVLQWR